MLKFVEEINMSQDLKFIANEILKNLGGEENISVMEHCATRLRVVVKDNDRVQSDALKKIPGVGGYFYQSGQHQVILGTGRVNKVYDLLSHNGSVAQGNIKQEAYANLSLFQKGVRALADVFVPLIPVLVATGLFMGLRGFLQQLGVEFSPAALTLSQMVTDTVFIFLPALVVWSTFKRFGGTPVIGMVLGLMLVAPMLPNAWAVAGGSAEALHLGFIQVIGFQGTIIPALIVGMFGAWLEKWIRTWMPNVVDLVFTPFLTILIGAIVAFVVIRPIFTGVEYGVMVVVRSLVELPFGIGGAIIGAFQQALVVTGLHQSLLVIESSYLSAPAGINPLNALFTASMAGQAGAAIAYSLRIRSKEQRALKLTSIVPCFFGITEPLLFGITFTNSRLFVSGMIGGAVAGAFASIIHLAPSVMGVTFLPAIPAYLGHNLFMYLVMIAVGLIVGMVASRILVRDVAENA